MALPALSPEFLKRLESKFQSKLSRDMRSVVESPFQTLKLRYAKTKVSEVGWLARDYESTPTHDVTIDFMFLVEALEKRAEDQAMKTGWSARVLRRLKQFGAIDHAESARANFSQRPKFRKTLKHFERHLPTHEISKEEELHLSMPVGVDSAAELEPFVFLLVPGLLSQYSPPIYWLEALVRLRDELGLSCVCVSVDSEAGTEANAAFVRDAILDAHRASGGKRVILIGHSKGGNDAAAALSLYPRELLGRPGQDTSGEHPGNVHPFYESDRSARDEPADRASSAVRHSNGLTTTPSARGWNSEGGVSVAREWDDVGEHKSASGSGSWVGGGGGVVAGLVCVQSPYGGSPIAADLLEDADLERTVEFLFSRVLRTRTEALHDLTYERRKAFVRAHPLPPNFPVLCFHTTTPAAPSFSSPSSPALARQAGTSTQGPPSPAITRTVQLGKSSRGAASHGVKEGLEALILEEIVAGERNCNATQNSNFTSTNRNGNDSGGVPPKNETSAPEPQRPRLDWQRLPRSLFYPTAVYLEQRYGAKSDGLVCCADAEVPGCAAVRYSRHELDHLAVVYPNPAAAFRRALRRHTAAVLPTALSSLHRRRHRSASGNANPAQRRPFESIGKGKEATCVGSAEPTLSVGAVGQVEEELSSRAQSPAPSPAGDPPSGGDLVEALARLLVRRFGLYEGGLAT